MNRLYPAETRLKEGAHAHDSDQNRWECSLAAGGWRPVSALLAVSRDCRVDVKRGKLISVARGEGSLLGLPWPGWWTHLVACRPKLSEVHLRAARFGGQPSRV